MSQTFKRLCFTPLAFLAIAGCLAGQSAGPAAPDLTRQPTLYVVGYAHLDTQWRWEYPQVIREYIPKTMRDNFALFEKYPHYIFNFTGANRYRMMKEYYPADYARVKQYVAQGRWFPAGSSVEEGDVNAPSAESLIRQILYGNEFFRREFGKASAEYMLPDCFGFPAYLPSILAHAGIEGFSTQKLTWGSAAPVGGANSPEDTPPGIPFNVGIWDGPDGHSVLAALNPGSYGSRVTDDLGKDPQWLTRVNLDGKIGGLFTDYHYYGTGDTGGAPDENSVKMVEESVTGSGPLRVVSSDADQMFLDIVKSDRASGLPHYKGDLELTNHSAGSLTSEAYQKRWNRKNELLADAAEKASVAAAWLGGRPYPIHRLNRAWNLVMGGQFHDIMAGTATPKAYEYSWNDDVIAMNQFANVLTDATAAIASGMNTAGKGVSLVVYNPLSIAREDVVEANVYFSNGLPKAVRVTGPDGKPVPAQVEAGNGGAAKVVFLAIAPSVGYAVYDVQAAASSAASSPLKVTESSLENARYRIRL
ncbi:MAG: alpha-mannosidase, partial [Bryobacteraceae bacterium]